MRTDLNSKRPRNNRSNMRRGPNQHGARSLDSNGPKIKIRGSASQTFEKYLVHRLIRNVHEDQKYANVSKRLEPDQMNHSSVSVH